MDSAAGLQAHLPCPFRRARVPRVRGTAGSRGAPGLRQIRGLGGLGELLVEQWKCLGIFHEDFKGINGDLMRFNRDFMHVIGI